MKNKWTKMSTKLSLHVGGIMETSRDNNCYFSGALRWIRMLLLYCLCSFSYMQGAIFSIFFLWSLIFSLHTILILLDVLYNMVCPILEIIQLNMHSCGLWSFLPIYFLNTLVWTNRNLLHSLFQNRLNLTKTIRKFSIDHDLKPTGSEFHSGPVLHQIKHGDEVDEESSEECVSLKAHNFDQYSHQ